MDEIRLEGKTVSKELMEIILKRIDAMPSTIKLAVLGEVLDKHGIISAIENRTPVGLEILKMEIDFYKDLVRD